MVGITERTIGTPGSRKFVVQWNNALPQGSTSPVTFQVVLSEGTNQILFQYQTVSAGASKASNGGLASIGIHNTGGKTNGQQIAWSYAAAVLTDNSAIAFNNATTVAIGVNTSPSGRQVIVDGTTYVAPQTFNWIPGSTHTIDSASPQTAPGTQYLWTAWSVASSSGSPTTLSSALQSITVPSAATTYTAQFQTQYWVTFAESGIPSGTAGAVLTFGGTPYTASQLMTGVSNWYPAGTSLSYTYAATFSTGTVGQAYTLSSVSTASPAMVSGPLTISGNYDGWAFAWATSNTFSAQYSDPSNLRAVLQKNGQPLPGAIISFSVVPASGTPASGTATADTTGVATDGTVLKFAPTGGTIQYTASAECAPPNCAIDLKLTSPFTVTREDARATYSGAQYVATSTASSTTANVTLAYTIRDISAAKTDSATDNYPGDIRNAHVTFVNRDVVDTTSPYGYQILADGVTIALVNSNDTTTATAVKNVTINAGNCAQSPCAWIWHIGAIVTGYYTRNSSYDDTELMIAQPGTNFITGGGSLLLSSSAGLKPGDAETSNDFAFDVKYNKSVTNPQGAISTIVRSGGRVYQIKGNSMTSLSVQAASSTHPATATFTGKASIQDITDQASPISVDGNATLQVVMTDNGPTIPDTIAITIWNKTGALWFASNWDGTKAVQQTVASGGLAVQ
jgi:hypothetical protein